MERAGRRGSASIGALVLLLATGCPLQTVQIASPRSGSLHDDAIVAVDVRTGRNFVHDGTIVRVDGVDLAAALGLAAPFAGASGDVTIAGDVVSVSEFTYSIPPAPGAIRVTARLAGLPAGDHVLGAEATPAGGGAPTAKAAPFAVVPPFTLEADVIASAGTPPRAPVQIGGVARSVTLGDAFAAPPAATGGGELRSGFVPAAQGRAGGF